MDVSGNAYDLVPDETVRIVGGFEPFADGVLIGKEPLRGGLGDDGDGARGFGVLRGEGAAGDDGDAHDLDEIGPYIGEVGATAEIVPLALDVGRALDAEVGAGLGVGDKGDVGDGYVFDTGNSADCVFELMMEGDVLRCRI